MVQILGETSKMIQNMRSGRVTKIHPSFLSVLYRRRTKGHWTQHEHLVLGVKSVTVSYLIHNDSLSQNITDIITKCDKLFYYKMRQKFITKCVRFYITKCDSFNIKCDSYYKLRRFYYKMQQLLQNATFMTNCDSTHGLLSNHLFQRMQEDGG